MKRNDILTRGKAAAEQFNISNHMEDEEPVHVIVVNLNGVKVMDRMVTASSSIKHIKIENHMKISPPPAPGW